jgi:hypothetical protein
MPPSTESKARADELPDVSKLKLEAGEKEASPKESNKTTTKVKKPVVADSWDDESEEEDNEEGGVKLDSDAEPDSDDERFGASNEDSKTSETETSYLKDVSPFYSGEKSGQTVAGPRRERPTTTMMVANRLIASGTGHRIKRTEEQRKADKEKFEAEKAKRQEEKKRMEEAEKAKRSVWED